MRYKRIFLASGLILLLMFYIYHPTFTWLYDRFSAPDSYYSHGFLIPFVSIFLIWLRRDRLKCIKPETSGLGLSLLLMGLLIQIVSIILGVYLISEFSLIMVISGITLYLFGRKIIKEILLPITFLIFMIPVPMFIINYIGFPMRVIVTNSVVFTLSRFGLPVVQKGFEIIFPNTSLAVDTPCSGLRSLITFLALGSLFAYFVRGTIMKKISIFIMSIPVAFFSNYIRIILLSLFAFIYGAKAATEGFFHDLSGIMVFMFGFVFLLIVRSIINERP